MIAPNFFESDGSQRCVMRISSSLWISAFITQGQQSDKCPTSRTRPFEEAGGIPDIDCLERRSPFSCLPRGDARTERSFCDFNPENANKRGSSSD
jgi:hypothetical protein